MKLKALMPLSTGLLLVLLACQGASTDLARPDNRQPQEPAAAGQEAAYVEGEEVWVPAAIDECLSKVHVGEPFEVATSINPFYLRADLDGNGLVDYAILIHGRETKKKGLVICKDSKEPFIFGAIAKSKKQLSTFEDDDFITKDWVVETKERTGNLVEYPGGRGVAADAKGESVAFIFDGGNLFIYWDGKTFKVVRGS